MPAARTKKPKPVISLSVPAPIAEIDRWLVVGLDPSLSRTGYALMWVMPGTKPAAVHNWADVGSLKPENASDPVWIRSKGVALALVERINHALECFDLDRTGLIISMEAPTPRNDFLSSINRILHLVMFDGTLPGSFVRTYVQMTNASTLRSLMGLKTTGAKNKVENITKAFTFLDKSSFSNLDTDACDAVLMAMMGRYSAGILLGDTASVPERFLLKMCDGREEIVGKGTNCHKRTVGLLHRPEYWRRYERQRYTVLLRDARVKKARLDRLEFPI